MSLLMQKDRQLDAEYFDRGNWKRIRWAGWLALCFGVDGCINEINEPVL
jgi:hypothetical protein